MKLYIVEYISHYEGEFGDLEGPTSTIKGVFDSYYKAKDITTKSEKYKAQYGSAMNGYVIHTVELNKIIDENTKREFIK